MKYSRSHEKRKESLELMETIMRSSKFSIFGLAMIPELLQTAIDTLNDSLKNDKDKE